MNLIWLRRASTNLEREYQWLHERNPTAALNFANEVYELTSLLITQPAMGRAGRVMGTRELVLHNFPYLLPYRVKNNEIQILRVFHTYREPPKDKK
ncbi:Plasmid stabilisation system protein [Yersinia massiliensis]|uniref:type II toxin-antitoxin system RelE/ParE family toxin n=1 Tax=Yersinia massiliensis TaxID=419257 RepID=UPI0005DE2C61|nr:type II toxin-antitoxin system RelE/ParE family toxin [Yersinia massiliensis]CNI55246.1 Plasmid stabilisation system protein [Yersinia massiliensis]